MPNNCSHTYHVGDDLSVTGTILRCSGPNEVPFMVLTIGRVGDPRIDLIIKDPAFLDRLSNEADRLCREYVGDVPPLEPLPAAMIVGGEA